MNDKSTITIQRKKKHNKQKSSNYTAKYCSQYLHTANGEHSSIKVLISDLTIGPSPVRLKVAYQQARQSQRHCWKVAG